MVLAWGDAYCLYKYQFQNVSDLNLIAKVV